jgi:hypothetical protein
MIADAIPKINPNVAKKNPKSNAILAGTRDVETRPFIAVSISTKNDDFDFPPSRFTHV